MSLEQSENTIDTNLRQYDPTNSLGELHPSVLQDPTVVLSFSTINKYSTCLHSFQSKPTAYLHHVEVNAAKKCLHCVHIGPMILRMAPNPVFKVTPRTQTDRGHAFFCFSLEDHLNH